MGVEVLLDLATAMCGDRVAVGSRDGGLTFDELAAHSDGAAALIRGTGAHHVAFVGLNGPALSVAVFAAAKAGVPITPLNYRLSHEQLEELLDTLDNPLVIADEAFIERVAGPGRSVLPTPEFLAKAQTTPPLGEPAPENEPAVVLFTSGTTSKPKGVMLRHENLTSYSLQTVEMASAGEDECALISVPPYHVAGIATVLTNTYAGRRVVHLPDFDPQMWLETVRQEGVTSAMVVPTMLARIVDFVGDGGKADVPTLRSLAYGGARLPRPVLERALAAFPDTGFINAYGLTETSSTIAVLGPDDHRAAVDTTDEQVRARLGSAGQAVPGVEFAIRGEDGHVLPAGEPGALWVRGAQVSGEYVGQGSLLDADGWFHTRDRGWLDDEGYLFIEGRTDDTIIRGGENVAPAEIEDVLVEHPAVKEAAVVGIPDDEWGERIAAVVVANPGMQADGDQIREWARGRLRGSKTPDSITVWPELPYNQLGKLLRRDVVSALLAGTTPAPA
ncbi:MAG TPA: AMP-binding protein [Mycobacteriales bacterium]|nr:AMP-binding protein [Mycobacteriales bacterium]